TPLPFLYDVHPEARYATPHDLGTMTIDVADIAGTAVGPAKQRGMDFLPLKPLRTLNWRGRWQRVRDASLRLAVLPPIDVVRYAGRDWGVDGHNRVAAALYNGQLGIDADVIDLDPRSASGNQGGSLAAQLEERDARTVRFLAVSDEEDPALEHAVNRDALGPIDGIIGCGDLEATWLGFLS